MYFSPAEWALLGEEQKQLYRHVMWENYQTLVSLGIQTPKPVVISSIERGEELCVQGLTEDGDILRGTHPAGARNLSRAEGQTPEEGRGNLEPLKPFPGTSGKNHSQKTEWRRHHKR
ncbi:zinc finger protein 75A-like, partial [Terrapene carolina triunguis]|uniref:zinc finger protein 75A-like n=1 Tax=Terrapene triunguis TaxID=2587831 RepID=UPI0011560EF3